jgi:hypothetical protein
MKLRLMTISLLGLGLAVAPAFADLPTARTEQPARPGTVNYVEGTVSVDGQAVTPKQVGSVGLEAGQELTTGTGKAEVLLTPGVFLRVDDNSTVKLVSPDLANTQVQVEKGRAGVEVDEIYKENNLQVMDAGVTTRLQKTGYYQFDANSPAVLVFKGKADVELAGGRTKEIKGNHEAALVNDVTSLKSNGIEENRDQDGLYNWSRLRSEYLAEANQQLAPEYGGAGYAPGWYWDPYGFGYTFIGGGPFYSPFGWGFYPLGWGWGGYYGGYYGRPYYGGRGGEYHRFGTTHGGTFRGGAVHGGESHSFATRPSAGSFGGFHGGVAHGGGGHR